MKTQSELMVEEFIREYREWRAANEANFKKLRDEHPAEFEKTSAKAVTMAKCAICAAAKTALDEKFSILFKKPEAQAFNAVLFVHYYTLLLEQLYEGSELETPQ